MGSKVTLKRHDITLATQLAAQGATLVSIAKALGVSKRTFDALRERDRRLAEAVDLGRAALQDELVSLLVKKARDGDNVALLFALKSMFGFRDRGDAPGAIAPARPAVQVNVNLPRPMDPAEFAKVIDVKEEPRD